ncbi:hypothetical protein F4780DRAFT_393962 [Xylariomycetidae sp. FL0641]|nr:hypothetical protein F4780DRAFT_393962 [Xylariomycetidae sp. FL0641]
MPRRRGSRSRGWARGTAMGMLELAAAGADGADVGDYLGRRGRRGIGCGTTCWQLCAARPVLGLGKKKKNDANCGNVVSRDTFAYRRWSAPVRSWGRVWCRYACVYQATRTQGLAGIMTGDCWDAMASWDASLKGNA